MKNIELLIESVGFLVSHPRPFPYTKGYFDREKDGDLLLPVYHPEVLFCVEYRSEAQKSMFTAGGNVE